MKIWDMQEKEDGSCVLEIEMNEYEKQMLIEKGFVTMLEEFLDSHEQQFIAE